MNLYFKCKEAFVLLIDGGKLKQVFPYFESKGNVLNHHFIAATIWNGDVQHLNAI
jgi:hypothetical protein